MTKTTAIAARIADVILLAGAAVAVCNLGIAIYHYGIVGDRTFSGAAGPILYYGIPVVLASALFATLRLRPVFKVSAVGLGAVVGGGVLGAELHLRGRMEPGVLPRWNSINVDSPGDRAEIIRLSRATGIRFDMRGLPAVVADLQQHGMDAVPIVTMPRGNGAGAWAWRDEPFPLAAVADRETVLCNESGEWVVNRADEHGFNNPLHLWTRSKIDIVALGESFTYGYCVREEHSYVGLIRKSFPATLNLGFSGGPMLASAIFREYAVHLKPRIILWFHCEGIDLYDLWDSRGDPVYRKYVEDRSYSQRLIDRQAAVDGRLLEYHRMIEGRARRDAVTATAARLQSVLGLGALREHVGLTYGRGTKPATSDSTDAESVLARDNIAQLQTILSDLKGTAAAWGARVYFVYQPHWERFARASTRMQRERSVVLSLVRSMEIPVIDVATTFEAHPDPLALFPFRRFGHYGDGGHRLVAEAVLRAISSDVVHGMVVPAAPQPASRAVSKASVSSRRGS